MNTARIYRNALRVLAGLTLLFAAACDNTSTTTYTRCFQNEFGDQICCTTRCEYDDDCYYYYGGDCDVSCVETCYNNSATPVSTAVHVTPSTRLPTPTRTPGAPNHIDVGSAIARPGDEAVVTVSLVAPSASVAATGNDITFDPSVLGLDPSACVVNPAIGKSLVASVVQEDSSTKTLRIFVSSDGNANAIPDGALYTCTFAISPSALPGAYPVANSGALAFGPDGAPLDDVVGVSGNVTVSLVVLPTPTATATATP